MRKLLFLLLIGCGDSMTEVPLTKEFYEWYCKQETEDYPLDKVYVTTNTCDESVTWIVAELQLYDGERMLRRLEKDNLSVNCEWETDFPLINDYYCDDVEGVDLTAWAK